MAVPYFFMFKIKGDRLMEINNGTYCIYVHTNKINGKMYVGQTIKGNYPHRRWDNGNGYQNCTYFYRAIQKHGWDNFEHEVVANNLTAQEADNFEILLIDKLDTTNPDKGYNISPGGVQNKTLSEATKKKISESHMGEKNPMYGIRLVGEKNGMYGKKLSEEHKQKLLDAARKANVGKTLSEETKKKLSESAKERFSNPENNPFYGKRHTEESKKKMSEAKKGEKSYHAKQVVQMDNDYNVIKIWGCIADAYRTLNICRQSIPEVLNGQQHRAGGYRWAYLYDNVKKNGDVIAGAISLGYITEEEVKNVKSACI